MDLSQMIQRMVLNSKKIFFFKFYSCKNTPYTTLAAPHIQILKSAVYIIKKGISIDMSTGDLSFLCLCRSRTTEQH